MGKKDKKEEFLEATGALNPKPEQVKDRKFSLPHGFFDPRDKIQVKYEMLRAHEIDGENISEAAPRFGYTRESFYTSVGGNRKGAKSGSGGVVRKTLSSRLFPFLCSRDAV